MDWNKPEVKRALALSIVLILCVYLLSNIWLQERWDIFLLIEDIAKSVVYFVTTTIQMSILLMAVVSVVYALDTLKELRHKVNNMAAWLYTPVTEKEAKINRLTQRLESMQQQNDELQAHNERLHQNKVDLEEEKARKQTDILEMELHWESAEKDLKERQNVLKDDIDEKSRQKQVLEKELQEKKKQATFLTDEIEKKCEEKKKIRRMEEIRNNLQGQINKMEEERKNYERENERMREQNNKLQEEMETVVQHKNKLEEERARLTQTKAALKDEVKREKEKKKRIEEEIMRKGDEIGNLEEHITRKREELETLHQQQVEEQAAMTSERNVDLMVEMRQMDDMLTREYMVAVTKALKGRRNRPEVRVHDEETLAAVEPVFVAYVIPLNILYIIHHHNANILMSEDIEVVRNVTKNVSKFEGAAELLNRLSRYPGWYDCILRVLRDPVIKLGHVAGMMEEAVANAQRMRQEEEEERQAAARAEEDLGAEAGATAAGGQQDTPRELDENTLREHLRNLCRKGTAMVFPEWNDIQEGVRRANVNHLTYDEEILSKIGPVFVMSVIPLNFLPLVHLYDRNVLVQHDIEAVSTKTTNEGKREGAAELLSRLSRYRGWFQCTLKVLRDPRVRQRHLAEKMEELVREPVNASHLGNDDNMVEVEHDGVLSVAIDQIEESSSGLGIHNELDDNTERAKCDSTEPASTSRMMPGSNSGVDEVTSKQEIDILLFGKTGHGRSSTGNTILGRNEFKTSCKSTSGTYDVHVAWTEFDKYLIKVVDAPGVAETRLETVEATQKACDDMAKAMLTCPKGFHVLLLVLHFGVRFTKEEEESIKMLKSFFGKDIIRRNCVIVFTHGDNFDPEDDYYDFSDWLQNQDGELKNLIKECHYRCVLMENKAKDEKVLKSQMRDLMQTIDAMRYREVRYTNELFDSVQQERNRLVVSVKAPLLKEEIMRDTNLMFDDLAKLKKSNDLDKADTTLLQLEKRIKDLLERIDAEDNETGVLTDLKKTVSNIQQVVVTEKFINSQRKEDRKIQVQLIKEHKENIAKLQVQHAKEKNKLEGQLRTANNAEKAELEEKLLAMERENNKQIEQINSTFNLKMENAKAEGAQKWQYVLDQNEKKHDEQMKILRAQYKKMEEINAETTKNNQEVTGVDKEKLLQLQRAKAPPKDPSKVTLYCRDQSNLSVSVTIKKTEPIGSLMHAYCGISGYEIHFTRFYFDDKEVKATQTPTELNLEDEDMIEAMYWKKEGCSIS